MNVEKANYICFENKDYPERKEDINQKRIFENQLQKYVQKNCEVAVLCSFPLFLYEYSSDFILKH